MPVLDCSVKTCSYNANEENKCTLNSIKVEGKSADYSDDTACGSYKLRTDDGMTSGCCGSKKTTLDVACSANKCVFNEGNKCHAEHIGIAGGHAETMDGTECASFVSKEDK